MYFDTSLNLWTNNESLIEFLPLFLPNWFRLMKKEMD